MKHTLSFQEITNFLEQEGLLVSANIPESELKNKIEYISHTSADIQENTLFFCKGAHFKKEYLEDAINKGAIAYLADQDFDLDLPHFVVKNLRLAIAKLAALFYDYPANKLNLTGITGTKGKTTVAYFLKFILDSYTGVDTGLMGTMQTITGKRKEDSHNTTPEPIDLEHFLDEAVESKLPYFTMEVTSQAYKVDRVYGIDYKNAAWLNISEDHISPAEHPDFEDYISCKLQLMKHARHIVINRETDHFERVYEAAKSSPLCEDIMLFASDKYKDEVDYYFCNVKKVGAELRFTVKSEKMDYEQDFAIRTFGLFNVENAMAAFCLAKNWGIPDEAIRQGLLDTEIPGRMTLLEKDGVTIVIDYAHNRVSFEKLFEAIKADYPNNRILSLGGGQGEKAYERRQEFGEVVGHYSDYVYLTADDPAFESVTEIAQEIASYFPEDTAYEIIEDRETAVRKIFKEAKAGDIIVLLSKGADKYQKTRGKIEYYPSDLALAKELIK